METFLPSVHACAQRRMVGTQAATLVGPQKVYSRWTPQGQDIIGDESGERIGYTIAMSDHGLTMAVGTDSLLDPVRIRVYRYTDQQWGIIERFANETGINVKLSSDGTILAFDIGGSDLIECRVYHYDRNTEHWSRREIEWAGETESRLAAMSSDLGFGGS